VDKIWVTILVNNEFYEYLITLKLGLVIWNEVLTNDKDFGI